MSFLNLMKQQWNAWRTRASFVWFGYLTHKVNCPHIQLLTQKKGDGVTPTNSTRMPRLIYHNCPHCPAKTQRSPAEQLPAKSTTSVPSKNLTEVGPLQWDCFLLYSLLWVPSKPSNKALKSKSPGWPGTGHSQCCITAQSWVQWPHNIKLRLDCSTCSV